METRGFEATAWINGRWSRTGAAYGLKIPIGDRNRFFRESWGIHAIGRMTGRKVPKRALPACLFRAVAHIQNTVGNLRGAPPDLTPQAAHFVLAKGRMASDK